MDEHEELRKEIERVKKIVQLNEKKIAELDLLLSREQQEDVLQYLRERHDKAVDEWYFNYEYLLSLISLLE